jgi:hypothetical protein
MPVTLAFKFDSELAQITVLMRLTFFAGVVIFLLALARKNGVNLSALSIGVDFVQVVSM